MSEWFKVRLVLVLGVLFIVSMVTSCDEMRYVMFGQQAQASVLRTYEIYGGRLVRRVKAIGVEYRFTDKDGKARRETDRVPVGIWNRIGEQSVTVQYLEGEGNSRVHGHNNFELVWVFLAGLGAMVFAVFWFWRYYKS